MVPDTRDYLVFLGKTVPALKPALYALDRFENALRNVSTRQEFLLPHDLLERICRFHIHCGMDMQGINRVLDQEIDEIRQILDHEAVRIMPDRITDHHSHEIWIDALRHIPPPATEKDGLIGLYKSEVDNLANHCLDKGIVLPDMVSSCPVRVAPVPDFLSAIRTASSYSISPKHPPSGGTFYIINPYVKDGGRQEPPLEYKMLSAHETFPGHHVLDASRWGLKQTCRRVVEQPIFYEGWACFAEELMRVTGYFSDPGDRLLLAKRRLWRAIRGKVDIGLQTGSMDIPTAARCLKEIGIDMERAVSSARKYPLNPGYQLCYTLGLRRFLDLFDKYGRDNLQSFVHTVLGQGEINLEDLEKILNNINN